jgi:hypothetical protein
MNIQCIPVDSLIFIVWIILINFDSDSYTMHYWLSRDQPTKCTEIIYFFIYLYNGSYMFQQNM